MKKFYSFLLICSAFISCKKDDPNVVTLPDTLIGNTLRDNARIVDSTNILILELNKVSMAKTGAQNKYAIGDVLLIPATNSDPFGGIRRVLKVSETSTEYIYETDNAALNEAFKSLNINDSSVSNYSSTVNAKVEDASLTIELNKEILGINMKGVIKINNPGRKFEYVLKEGAILPEKVLLQFDMNTMGSAVEFTNKESKNTTILTEHILHDFNKIPPIRIIIPIITPIGIFPFPLIFSQNVLVTAMPWTVSGKFQHTFSYSINATLGAKFENRRWKDISTISLVNQEPRIVDCKLFNIAVTSDLTLLQIRYILKPYNLDALQASLGVAGKCETTVQNARPNLENKIHVLVKGEIQEKFLTKDPTVFSIGSSLPFLELIHEANVIDACGPYAIVNTLPITTVTSTSAISGGNVTEDGGNPVTERGVCWSTSPTPDFGDDYVSNGVGTGEYKSEIKGLNENTNYYVRAYANTINGTSWGNEVNFRTTATCTRDITGRWRRQDGLTFTISKSGNSINLSGTSANGYTHSADYNWPGDCKTLTGTMTRTNTLDGCTTQLATTITVISDNQIDIQVKGLGNKCGIPTGFNENYLYTKIP